MSCYAATPSPAPGDQDQTGDLCPRGSDASCSACWEQEEQHDQTEL